MGNVNPSSVTLVLGRVRISPMPRRPRNNSGGYAFHVLNRRAGKQKLFLTEADYEAFQKVLGEAVERVSMHLMAFCLMPNHWHLVLWPQKDNDLSSFMRWLTTTHAQRWHQAHGTSGTGALYQGRFKSFPVQEDEHLLKVCRYVERNALRANLVSRAEAWRWSSLWQWRNERVDVPLSLWPTPRGSGWIDYVNQVETEAELNSLRHAVAHGRPFGDLAWQREAARSLGIALASSRRTSPPV